jgi:hypothetical protein
MGSIDSGRKRFWSAVKGMAQSDRGLRERLHDAYQFHIAHVTDKDVPEGLRPDLAELVRMLNHRPSRGSNEGRCKATTDQMTDGEAEAAADLIMQLFEYIEEHYWEEKIYPPPPASPL